MIEKYFVLGARFKWKIPGGNYQGIKDGSIIENSNQTRARLVFLGLDPVVTGAKTPPGMTANMSIPYSWLDYTVGHTTRLSVTQDVLTGPMSGCLLPIWTVNGTRYVGHIGTGSDGTVNRRVKQTFKDSMPQNTIAFNPFKAMSATELQLASKQIRPFGKLHIIALLTSNNRCYSILMVERQRVKDELIVSCCKGVTPMNYQTIRTAIT